MEFELKFETRSFSFFRGEGNWSLELLYDLLGDHQAQANSVHVYLFVFLYEPEQFEKFILILLSYANSCVDHFYF